MERKSDFNNLSIDERAALVWRSGSFIDALSYYDQTISLYSVNKDFVEVWSDPRDNNRITRIATAREEQLKKYLSNVNLGRLFKV